MASPWTRGRWSPSVTGLFPQQSNNSKGSGFCELLLTIQSQFSRITNPLISFLRGKLKSLFWSTDATKSFKQLKQTFCSGPLLTHANPDNPFTVEVDASSTGVGAVLSQQQATPSKVHPCAFFSCKLSPEEKNYNIRNRELLAIKLAL